MWQTVLWTLGHASEKATDNPSSDRACVLVRIVIMCSSEVSTEMDMQAGDVQDDPHSCGWEIVELPLTYFVCSLISVFIGVLLILYVNIVVPILLHYKYIYVERYPCSNIIYWWRCLIKNIWKPLATCEIGERERERDCGYMSLKLTLLRLYRKN